MHQSDIEINPIRTHTCPAQIKISQMRFHRNFRRFVGNFEKKIYIYISDSSWHSCGLGIPARTWRALTRNNSQDYSRISIPNLEAMVQLDDKWASFPTNRETSWIFLSFRPTCNADDTLCELGHPLMNYYCHLAWRVSSKMYAASWLSFSVIENLLRENSCVPGNFAISFLLNINIAIRKYIRSVDIFVTYDFRIEFWKRNRKIST